MTVKTVCMCVCHKKTPLNPEIIKTQPSNLYYVYDNYYNTTKQNSMIL